MQQARQQRQWQWQQGTPQRGRPPSAALSPRRGSPAEPRSNDLGAAPPGITNLGKLVLPGCRGSGARLCGPALGQEDVAERQGEGPPRASCQGGLERRLGGTQQRRGGPSDRSDEALQAAGGEEPDLFPAGGARCHRVHGGADFPPGSRRRGRGQVQKKHHLPGPPMGMRGQPIPIGGADCPKAEVGAGAGRWQRDPSRGPVVAGWAPRHLAGWHSSRMP